MMQRILIVCALLSCVAVGDLRAQNSITFEQFAELVDPYFAPELVQDVKNALPQSPFDVWGYDVGDFSADSIYDIAVSIRMRNDRRKEIKIYFFVDDEGILLPVKEMTTTFVELPIEVGVSISDGKAHLVRKLDEFSWEITGYRFENGVMMMADHYVTNRDGAMVREVYRNYLSLEGTERYLDLNGKVLFDTDFLAVPSYSRGRDVSSGYFSTATASMTKFVMHGAYYWQGESDLSVDVRSAYDEEYLYFNIFVRDDEVVPVGVDEEAEVDTSADRLDIWIDAYSLGNRLRSGTRKDEFRMNTDTNVYAFHVTLGDFIDQPARVKVASSNIMEVDQSGALPRIKAVAARQDEGYSLKMRIPFALLGFENVPVGNGLLTEFGCSVVVHDIDNPYRPGEVTEMATSRDFEAAKPATFGLLVLVPEALYYGESTNIFLGDLKERLEEVGF